MCYGIVSSQPIMWGVGVLTALSQITYPALSAFVSLQTDKELQGTVQVWVWCVFLRFNVCYGVVCTCRVNVVLPIRYMGPFIWLWLPLHQPDTSFSLALSQPFSFPFLTWRKIRCPSSIGEKKEIRKILNTNFHESTCVCQLLKCYL